MNPIDRRTFLTISGAAQAQVRNESVTASATWDATPRIAVILSSFKGSEDHDGTKIAGLADPRPVDGELSYAQIDGMMRKALEIGVRKNGGLERIVGRDERVVILAGPQTDARLVRALVTWMVERRAGKRIALAGCTVEGVASVDLASSTCVEMPLIGKPLAASNRTGSYCVAKAIQQCDKVISLAAMRTDPELGVALSMANCFAIAEPQARQLGGPDEVLADLFSLCPADYAMVCGVKARHNVIVAGPKPLAVDSVAASIMGFDPADLPFLRLARRRGFGEWETDAIWIRGNEIDEARRPFPKPAGWRPRRPEKEQ